MGLTQPRGARASRVPSATAPPLTGGTRHAPPPGHDDRDPPSGTGPAAAEYAPGPAPQRLGPCHRRLLHGLGPVARRARHPGAHAPHLSLIHISEPTRLLSISS